MVISLIPAFNFRLNMGFRLKPHALCALRSLCQVLLQLFTLSLHSSHCCQACARPCEHPLSWRFGAGAAEGCPWPLLTMGRSSWSALMSCGNGGCPGSLWGSLMAPWQLEEGGLGSTWWPSLHNTQVGARDTRLQSKRPCSAGRGPFAGGCVML